jgi:hypothetical protein
MPNSRCLGRSNYFSVFQGITLPSSTSIGIFQFPRELFQICKNEELDAYFHDILEVDDATI